jgi:hypothetical protein
MRTVKALGLVALIVAVVTTMGFAKVGKSAIVGGPHDLRTNTSVTGLAGTAPGYTLCNFCHIAHKFADLTGVPASAGPLLWNHTLSSTTSYGTYTSSSFAGYGTDITDLGTVATPTVSNLCLSCHDGTVAVNSWYSTPGSGITNPGSSKMDLQYTVNDLTQQHPINFTYNAALATAAGIRVPASTTSVDGAGEIPLFQGKMQCATCHDPHNKSGIMSQAFPTQTSGTFCTYCHL